MWQRKTPKKPSAAPSVLSSTAGCEMIKNTQAIHLRHSNCKCQQHCLLGLFCSCNDEQRFRM
ncbi:hypothetical protein E2C01_047795 [Portunus trituberculatus]|uniref:Uncharacterized protein n=1 Tax=Portunus trituberculatus TaxID=210409 RepID=A0A5B7G4J0_PORTR|nr:hypothetical protein [Portunus trituberculatus]